MPVYRCFIRGENFPGALAGERWLVGFYTTRFVVAESAPDANATARRLLEEDESLYGSGFDFHRTRLVFERTEEMDMAPPASPGSGYSFFPMHDKPSWPAALLPPLVLLWPASSTYGPALMMATPLFGLVVLYGAIRVVARIPSRAAAPADAAAGARGGDAALVGVQLSLAPAREVARTTAAAVQSACDRDGVCPTAIADWEPRHDAYSSQTRVGGRVKWPLLYRAEGDRFTVVLYQLLDLQESWHGGARPR